MTFERADELTPMAHALAAWVTAFDHLVKLAGDGGLEELDGGGRSGSCRSSNGPGIVCR